MELKLNTYSASNSNGMNNISHEYGTMVLKNNILLEFIESDGIGILKREYESHYFPIESNKYDVVYLDETDKQHKSFDAKISIQNSLPIYFYVKLTPPEKQQLKWMNKDTWIHKNNNMWHLIVFIVGTILSMIWIWITFLGNTTTG